MILSESQSSLLFQQQIQKILKLLKLSIYLKFKENKIQFQNNNSSSCGYHSIKFLTDRYQGKQFKECTGFDDSVRGERNINKFIKRFDYI